MADRPKRRLRMPRLSAPSVAAVVAVASRAIPLPVRRRIRDAVRRNLDAVLNELRESREAYDIAVRWAAGQPVSKAEFTLLQDQLWDICKTIPALAIFLMPFGFFVLYVLIHHLKMNLLPSSFGKGKGKGKA